MWFSCSLGGNWNDPPVPSCWKSTIEHGNGSNSHHGHFICLKLCRCRRRQTTEISDDTDCGAWPQAGEVQTPTVQQDDILDTALCHHLRRFVHHLPTLCGVQWSNLSSLIYSVFLLLSCSCLWSILVQCDRGDQPRAANCPRSINTHTGGEENIFW